MKVVHFHETVNNGTGNSKTSLPQKRKGKRRGQTMSVDSIINAAKEAAGVYETLKDMNEHSTIIDLCNKNRVAKTLFEESLGHLGVDMNRTSIEDGLARFLTSGPQEFRKVSPEARKFCRQIACLYPQLVKKASSSISTVKASNQAKFVEVDMGTCLEAAYLVVLKAAHEEAVKRNLDDLEFKNEAEKLLDPENENYTSALNKILGEEMIKPEGETPTLQEQLFQVVFDAVDLAMAQVSGMNVNEQLSVDMETTDSTTASSHGDRMYAVATKAFCLFCGSGTDRNLTQDQVEFLFDTVFLPRT